MLRSTLVGAADTGGRGFRVRSREVSRLEGLSDAVFGFAITLRSVSLEVPDTFDELVAMMRGFVASKNGEHRFHRFHRFHRSTDRAVVLLLCKSVKSEESVFAVLIPRGAGQVERASPRPAPERVATISSHVVSLERSENRPDLLQDSRLPG